MDYDYWLRNNHAHDKFTGLNAAGVPQVGHGNSDKNDARIRGAITGTDGIYCQVSRDPHTTETQIEFLTQIAERDGSGRDWPLIRDVLARIVALEERAGAVGTRLIYRVVHQLSRALADQHIYVEEGRFGKRPKSRPLYGRMKRDAARTKFDRLLVWNVSQLGRNMREVINTVYELAEHGVAVYPVKSKTGPINSTMGKLLWVIRAWYAEMEKEERSEVGHAGQAGAKSAGKLAGRPQVIVDRDEVVRLRDGEHRSWREIGKILGVSSGSVRRAYHARKAELAGRQSNVADEWALE